MKKQFIDQKTGLVIGSSLAVSFLLISQPANAQDSDPIADVETTLTSIGTISGTAAGIVLVAMGVRLAIKQVNRVMTKG